MSEDRAFFDTNILLYMYGTRTVKQDRARTLFDEYASAERAVLSTQVVQEFYAAGSRKLGLLKPEFKEIVAAFLSLPLVVIHPDHILSAIEIEERYGISFWDSLIVAAAESAEADILYTEDLNHGQRYGRVLVQNPFAN